MRKLILIVCMLCAVALDAHARVFNSAPDPESLAEGCRLDPNGPECWCLGFNHPPPMAPVGCSCQNLTHSECWGEWRASHLQSSQPTVTASKAATSEPKYQDPEIQSAYERSRNRFSLSRHVRSDAHTARYRDPNKCISLTVTTRNFSGSQCPAEQHIWRVVFYNHCEEEIDGYYETMPALMNGSFSVPSINEPLVGRTVDDNEISVNFGSPHFSECVPIHFVDSLRIRWCANWRNGSSERGETAAGIIDCSEIFEDPESHPRIVVMDRVNSGVD